MTDSKQTQHILEPLKVAIRLEEEGRKFFIEASQKIGSKFARRTFEFLAKEETKHIERINELYRSIEITGVADAANFDEEDADRRMAEFTDKLVELKDEIGPTDSDVEAYKLALKFENGAEEFYAKQMEESNDPQVKKFYRWLIREEEMHSRVIRSCLEFAEDPASWFDKR